MRKPHHVPLSAQALAILKEAHALSGRGKYVFPGIRTPLRPLSEHAQQRLTPLATAADEMTTHGYRSTASTLLNSPGKWSSDAIERALAHTDDDKVRGATTAANGANGLRWPRGGATTLLRCATRRSRRAGDARFGRVVAARTSGRDIPRLTSGRGFGPSTLDSRVGDRAAIEAAYQASRSGAIAALRNHIRAQLEALEIPPAAILRSDELQAYVLARAFRAIVVQGGHKVRKLPTPRSQYNEFRDVAYFVLRGRAGGAGPSARRTKRRIRP